MLTLYKSLIRSHLEYCCPLWHPHNSIANTQALENVQRVFTSKIHGCEDMDYWSRLHYLKLMSLQRRRERYIIIYVWKIIQGLTPNDISLTWHYNDRLGIKVNIPPHKKNSILKDTLAVTGPKLWNTLPKSATLKQSLVELKADIKDFFAHFPDHPPVKGYPSSKNSILDYSLNKLQYTARGGQHSWTT